MKSRKIEEAAVFQVGATLVRLNKINEIDYLQDLSKVHEIFIKRFL